MALVKKALTLIEVTIVAGIIFVAVLGLWSAHITSLRLAVQARELNIAVDDAKDVMERLRSTAFTNLLDAFPNGGAINPAVVGGFILIDEAIVITYPNGTAGELLTIEVTISWSGKDRLPYARSFRTIRSRGL